MAQNITLLGASYSDVPAVELPKTGGGTAKFTDVSDVSATAADVLSPKTIYLADGTKATGTLNYSWMGTNPEFMSTVYTLNTTLDQTSYNGWTPSTTAKTIVAAQTLSPKVSMDLENYEYIIIWASDCNVAYTSSWSASKGSPLRSICLYVQTIFKRPSTKAYADAGTFNYNVSANNVYPVYWVYYWSSTSATSLANTTYSACYISGISSPTFSSTSSDTPTVTLKTPVLSARCSTTYFTTANAALVDQANTTVKMKGELYRVKKGSSAIYNAWKLLDDNWITPI